MLHEVRCKCGRLLGKINGKYEIKCVRCKALKSGTIPIDKPYDPIKGDITNE